MAAGFRVYTGGAWHQATKISLYHSGAWVEVLRIRLWHVSGNPPVGAWKDVYVKSGTTPTPSPSPTPTPTPPPPAALTVTITPSPVDKSQKNLTGTEYTANVTATVSGGTGPYTITWSVISYDTGPSPPFATLPNAFTTQFAQPNMVIDSTATATFKATVVDSLGNIGSTTVGVTWSSYSYDSGAGSKL